MKLSDLRWSRDVSCNFMTPHGPAYIDKHHDRYIICFYIFESLPEQGDIHFDDICMLALFLVQCTPLDPAHEYYDTGGYTNAEPDED
jgi:hypothetical protein